MISTCLKESLVLASWIRASHKSASSATAWRSQLILVTTLPQLPQMSVVAYFFQTSVLFSPEILAYFGSFITFSPPQLSNDDHQITIAISPISITPLIGIIWFYLKAPASHQSRPLLLFQLIQQS